MKIRSITFFLNPQAADFEENLAKSAALAGDCKTAFEKKSWEVQTLRLATTPFGHYTTPENRIEKICTLEKQCATLGFTYLSVGPARISQPDEYQAIPQIIAATQSVFATGLLSNPQRGINLPAVRACARIIKETALIRPNGFANLNFCAMSHVPPFTPFFPAAYSYGSQPAFAIAMQAADAAVDAFAQANDIADGRNRLLTELNTAADELGKIARLLGREAGFSFKGFDFSLAPFPEDWCSLGGAMERLGAGQVGMAGTLASAAILAETLERGDWLHAGFNGMMLPVLEDSVLAARTAGGAFTVKDLLMVSAVCGTGLDTVPLPGDITSEQLEALLLDITALSLRLRKPLTARLMPVPGLKAGEMTAFNFAFFRNGRVMDYPAQASTGPISKSEWIEIRERKPPF